MNDACHRSAHSAVAQAGGYAPANRLTRAILAPNADRNCPVAVLLPRGANAIRAVLKAGRICVAIDSSFPREGVADLLDDSQANLLVSNDALMPALAELAPPGYWRRHEPTAQKLLPAPDTVEPIQ